VTTDKDQQKGYASVNGLDLYYEIRGSGEPLVLLPGGFMTVEAMGELVPQLAATRRVIGVELQGHGHTADIERALRFESMADDIAALIRHLGLEQADIFGFSLGGGVGLQTAIKHPEVVRKLALASTPFKRDGWYPEVLTGMASISVETFAGTPIHEAYLKSSPRPEAWPTFVAKMRQLLSEDYDWEKGVAELKTPTLILVGDADGLRLAHVVEFFGLLGGGKADGDMSGLPAAGLAVLPATTHVGWAPPYHGIMTRTQLLLPIITEFLDSTRPVAR
jgi:pimeloyl-ACP methyl ester carboxylesterase